MSVRNACERSTSMSICSWHMASSFSGLSFARSFFTSSGEDAWPMTKSARPVPFGGTSMVTCTAPAQSGP